MTLLPSVHEALAELQRQREVPVPADTEAKREGRALAVLSTIVIAGQEAVLLCNGKPR